MEKVMKDNKGYSLVGLMVSILIAVALVVIIAPRLLEYVQGPKQIDDETVVSRQEDVYTTSLQQTAENILSVVKSEYASEKLTGFGTITIKATNRNGPVQITPMGTLNYNPSWSAFEMLCGLSSTKTVKSEDVYTITIGGIAESPSITMTKS